MSSLSSIREGIKTTLGTLADLNYKLAPTRIHLGHHPRLSENREDTDYRFNLIEDGPQVIIKPGEVTTWDVQMAAGLARINIIIDFGFEPMKDYDFKNEEDFIWLIIYALSNRAGGVVPQTISVTKPKMDQELTGVLEYLIICDGYPIC